MRFVAAVVFGVVSISAASAAANAAPALIQQTSDGGKLDEAGLIAIGRSKAAVANDQFSADPTLAYVGKEFAITVPSSDLDISYDRNSRILTVSLRHQHSPDLGRDAIELASDVQTSTYSGQNAFGAQRAVVSERGNTFGILIPSDPYTRLLFSYTAELDAEVARELSKSIRLRLFGKVTRDEHRNTAVISDLSMSAPTLNHPLDRWVVPYLVHVAFSKAEWVDSRTGVILSNKDVGDPASASPAGMVWGREIWLQLASAPKTDSLSAQFQRMRSKNRDLFSRIHAFIVKSPGRARLIVGPFDQSVEADTFSESLEKRGIIAFKWSNSDKDLLVPLESE